MSEETPKPKPKMTEDQVKDTQQAAVYITLRMLAAVQAFNKFTNSPNRKKMTKLADDILKESTPNKDDYDHFKKVVEAEAQELAKQAFAVVQMGKVEAVMAGGGYPKKCDVCGHVMKTAVELSCAHMNKPPMGPPPGSKPN